MQGHVSEQWSLLFHSVDGFYWSCFHVQYSPSPLSSQGEEDVDAEVLPLWRSTRE